MADPVRVLVVDDEPMVCAHLRTIVTGYVSAVMRELDRENRTQAGLLAFAAGIVGNDDPGR